eukprot:scaffold20343_cov103-Isochrysis_galbana.AAC.9
MACCCLSSSCCQASPDDPYSCCGASMLTYSRMRSTAWGSPEAHGMESNALALLSSRHSSRKRHSSSSRAATLALTDCRRSSSCATSCSSSLRPAHSLDSSSTLALNLMTVSTPSLSNAERDGIGTERATAQPQRWQTSEPHPL